MEQTTRYEIDYPIDPSELKTFYANYVNIYYLPQEVYLEFCIVQPQSADPMEVSTGSAVAKVRAAPFARVIVSREHAKRLAELLTTALGQPSGGKAK